MAAKYMLTEVKVEQELTCGGYDGIIFVSSGPPGQEGVHIFKNVLTRAAEIDEKFSEVCSVLPIDIPAKRLIYSPIGPVDYDYDDVRVYRNAAVTGMKRALDAGVRSPLLAVCPDERFYNVQLVSLLGALEALYVPLQVREFRPKPPKVMGFWSPMEKLDRIVGLAMALESGRCIARDIGGSDPERMAPPRVEEYIRNLFSGTPIKIEVTSDPKELEREYPLFAAVNRAASVVPRHAGRVIFLTYDPEDSIEETVILVGKGVTFDTGGNDIKINHNMVGMSRDKCGAGGCVGFMQTVNLLRPKNIKVIVAIGVVRNSCGENAYVADEVITARSGVRVRVNNTDAEGRMVMADILCKMKSVALNEVNPSIFTVATLTGHAELTAGKGYSIAIDNSVGREISNAYKIQRCGEVLGEMYEVSIMRREDFALQKGKAEGDDVVQSGPKSSASTDRGHQGPAAFLVMTSGLVEHGKLSKTPLKYCHLDICGSECTFPEPVSGVPVLALSKRFFPKDFQ